MTIIAETLASFRTVRDAGRLDGMLQSIGADPDALMQETADLAATDATPAEAFIIGTMVARLTSLQENVILFELHSTGPTGSTERRTRPGLRRRRTR